MKGTRLWQSTGSPLISGRSRSHRPFWQPWLGASLVACAAVGLAVFLAAPGMVASLESILLLVCALLGAALGVWFSRQAGLRPAWIFGAACGVALAIVLFAVASLPALGALRSVVL